MSMPWARRMRLRWKPLLTNSAWLLSEAPGSAIGQRCVRVTVNFALEACQGALERRLIEYRIQILHEVLLYEDRLCLRIMIQYESMNSIAIKRTLEDLAKKARLSRHTTHLTFSKNLRLVL